MTRAAEEMNNKSSNTTTTTNVGGVNSIVGNADFEESGKNIVLNAAAYAQAYAYSAYDDIEKRLEIKKDNQSRLQQKKNTNEKTKTKTKKKGSEESLLEMKESVEDVDDEDTDDDETTERQR